MLGMMLAGAMALAPCPVTSFAAAVDECASGWAW